MSAAALPLSADDIYDAQRRLRGVAASTPALSHLALDEIAGRSVVCKAEALQRAGSFKFRGAYNAVAALSPRERRHGVIGASSGNHAQALALTGRLLSVPVTVVVPHDAPKGKVDGARTLGASIVAYHRQRDDRDEIVAQLAVDQGLAVVPSADAQAVMAGAGTAALELLWQAPVLTAILVPVGGGGLAAGTAVAAKHINPHIKVIGVEPAAAADTAASLHAGQITELPAVPDTVADGLRHVSPAAMPWEINKTLLDGVITVTDAQIVQAMGWAFKHLKVVTEPSGAVALAALAGLDLPPGPVGAILSGGSVDLDAFHRLVAAPPPRKEPALA
ncbi:threonine/serine dehydratase [Kitasatospora sp. A2-31]|uniref:threonine ammonia-lyase n=1 Tax=Kitasatospora sp. A2-31 TaxID=2916414 RepID=UPI001EED68FC|nr:pyridoxal-phosphate dependent enzyme [Kitasatospora sp. A2-31]MCG6499365.1 pyridoxal-phosphate dependent enzyme [Kitasatospora sp. A2-31]